MNKNFIIAAFVLIASAQVAFAEDLYPGLYQFDSCNVQYAENIGNSYMTLAGKDFSVKVTELKDTDLVQLKAHLDANELGQYRNYKIQSYRPHMNSLAQSYRTEFRSLNASTKLNVIKDLVEHLKTLNTCYTASLTTALDNKIAAYEKVIAAYKVQRDGIVAKNVTPTEMDKELAAAQTFMDELKSKASTATTLQEKRYIYQGYCLANGCAISISGATLWNQHLHAKFGLAKIKDTLEYMRPMIVEKGLTVELDHVDRNVSLAEAQIASAGKQRYNSIQVANFWTALKAASAEMKVILAKLNEAEPVEPPVVPPVEQPPVNNTNQSE